MSLGQTRAAIYAVMMLTLMMAANLLFLQPDRRRPADLAGEFGGSTGGDLITPAGYRSIEDGLAQSATTAKNAPGSGSTRPAALPPIEDTTVTAVQVIKGIQRELTARGYETGVQDGVSGMMTRAAVMAYEHDHNLPLTGEPDDELLNIIVLGSAGPGRRAPPVGNRRPVHALNVIRHVQRELKARRLDPGQTDGRLVPETATAIRAFEKAQGMKETGRISGELVGRLNAPETKPKPVAQIAPVQRKAAK